MPEDATPEFKLGEILINRYSKRPTDSQVVRVIKVIPEYQGRGKKRYIDYYEYELQFLDGSVEGGGAEWEYQSLAQATEETTKAVISANKRIGNLYKRLDSLPKIAAEAQEKFKQMRG